MTPVHFHHRHDAAGCDNDHGWPDWLLTILATLDRQETHMSALQDQIDTLSQQFATALAGIAAELDALKAAPAAEPTADLSGLESALAQAQALVPAPAPAAAEPAPVDAAPAPAVDAQPAEPAPAPEAQAADAAPAPSLPPVPLA